MRYPTTPEQDLGIVGWARGRLGRSYDFKNILGIELGRTACSPDKDDICSRYAVELLQWEVAPPFLAPIKNACLDFSLWTCCTGIRGYSSLRPPPGTR